MRFLKAYSESSCGQLCENKSHWCLNFTLQQNIFFFSWLLIYNLHCQCNHSTIKLSEQGVLIIIKDKVRIMVSISNDSLLDFFFFHTIMNWKQSNFSQNAKKMQLCVSWEFYFYTLLLMLLSIDFVIKHFFLGLRKERRPGSLSE